MSRYERANAKSGRLFPTEQEKLAANPKLPALNGTIVVDGVALYLGLWRRKSKNGRDYYTAELTYPLDETARLKATGPATSAAAKRERDYDAAHPQTPRHDKARWESRPQGGDDGDGGEDMPF